MKYLVVFLALSTLVLAGCIKSSDTAECGGVNNTGTLTGPITANCPSGSGGAGTTDRHDVQNPAPVVVVPPGSTVQ